MTAISGRPLAARFMVLRIDNVGRGGRRRVDAMTYAARWFQ
jgi:hypothetical protein